MFMNSSVRKQRDEELTDLFLSVLGNGMPAEATMALCAGMPCSRFWIEPEYAMRLIRARLDETRQDSPHKGRHAEKTKNTRLKIDEIMRRCGGDYSFANACKVVMSPAPQFYVSGRTAQAIIVRTLKERRRRNGNIH